MITEELQLEQEAIAALTSLGCREYEAECFVALCRLPTATAKEVSEVTDIPRTRVYDAMEGLSEKGVVEIHYGNPKRYRSVPLPQSLEWFREQYHAHLSTLEDAVQSLPPIRPDQIDRRRTVWSLQGIEAILIRINNMVADADSYVAVFVEDTDEFNRQVLELLHAVECPAKYVLSPSSVDASFLSQSIDTDTVEILQVDLPLTCSREEEDTGRPMTFVLSDGDTLLMRTRSAGCKSSDTEDHAVVAEGADNSVLVCFQALFGF